MPIISLLCLLQINLDFGIETCFGQNLTQLMKTGIQFIFPIYIWSIAIVIIIISHYSMRATRLFGNNCIAVLATLFLISYGKILRNVTDVLIYTHITGSDGSVATVWYLDGNVHYGKTAGHAILIIVALLFLALFLVPYTLLLLLVPFLRPLSEFKCLHWINTLKPFFDTHYGPFKDKKQHQVWTEILLISCVVILIVFASSSTFNLNTNFLHISLLLMVYSAM